MFDVSVDMSSVRRTFIPDIFLHQCCQHSLHNFSVMRRKSTLDKKKTYKNTITKTQKHLKNTTTTQERRPAGRRGEESTKVDIKKELLNKVL